MILIIFYLITLNFFANARNPLMPKRDLRPNIVLILADDLGFGDLGWKPFYSESMMAVTTPNLQKLATEGLILTNFHTASPVCSPSRASIMTGLFPWRLGSDFIYAGDSKLDGSIEMSIEQLPLIPNLAMSLKESGYYTAHIGKWHLGGMTPDAICSRRHGNCSVPGINHYGFDEYVGMSEGYLSDRYTTQQTSVTYHTGSQYIVRNDWPLNLPSSSEILTDRQTDEAMRVLRERAKSDTPFFLNLWFDAPHSPWEAIEPFYSQYDQKFPDPKTQKYASMISNMDFNIGRLLNLLDELSLSQETLLVFFSDNGPENGAGSPGPFSGRKRTVTEGGIRVPMIWRWPGHICPGTRSDRFVLGTDLFPTLMQAAKAPLPLNIRIDGLSALPVLLAGAGDSEVGILSSDSRPRPHPHPHPKCRRSSPIPSSMKRLHQQGDERTVLWYSHSPDFPKFTAAWTHGYKLVWNDYEGRPASKLPRPFRFFDLWLDPLEQNDLIPSLLTQGCPETTLSINNSTPSMADIWSELANRPRRTFSQLVPTHSDLPSSLTETPLSLSTSRSRLLAVWVLNYLHLFAHFFRYLGPNEWHQYHNGKEGQWRGTWELYRDTGSGDTPNTQKFLPSSTSSSNRSLTPTYSPNVCFSRSKPQNPFDSLSWRHAFLAPQFCQSSPPHSWSCLCSLSECPGMWRNQPGKGWTRFPLRFGLAEFANPYKGNSYSYLSHLLSQSRFSPLCPNSDQIVYRQHQFPNQDPPLPPSSPESSLLWATGTLLSHPSHPSLSSPASSRGQQRFSFLVPSLPSSSSHSSLELSQLASVPAASLSLSIARSTADCGPDLPLLSVPLSGSAASFLPLPISLCPSSFNSLQSALHSPSPSLLASNPLSLSLSSPPKNTLFDDNLFMMGLFYYFSRSLPLLSNSSSPLFDLPLKETPQPQPPFSFPYLPLHRVIALSFSTSEELKRIEKDMKIDFTAPHPSISAVPPYFDLDLLHIDPLFMPAFLSLISTQLSENSTPLQSFAALPPLPSLALRSSLSLLSPFFSRAGLWLSRTSSCHSSLLLPLRRPSSDGDWVWEAALLTFPFDLAKQRSVQAHPISRNKEKTKKESFPIFLEGPLTLTLISHPTEKESVWGEVALSNLRELFAVILQLSGSDLSPLEWSTQIIHPFPAPSSSSIPPSFSSGISSLLVPRLLLQHLRTLSSSSSCFALSPSWANDFLRSHPSLPLDFHLLEASALLTSLGRAINAEKSRDDSFLAHASDKKYKRR